MHNETILSIIDKGMYGLPHSGKIAYNKLKIHLKKGGYVPTGFAPGLFKHESRPIQFCLVVEDFGVKYINKEDANHPIFHLSNEYTFQYVDNIYIKVQIIKLWAIAYWWLDLNII